MAVINYILFNAHFYQFAIDSSGQSSMHSLESSPPKESHTPRDPPSGAARKTDSVKKDPKTIAQQIEQVRLCACPCVCTYMWLCRTCNEESSSQSWVYLSLSCLSTIQGECGSQGFPSSSRFGIHLHVQLSSALPLAVTTEYQGCAYLITPPRPTPFPFPRHFFVTQRYHGEELSLDQLGYTSVVQLLSSMPSICDLERPHSTGDWIAYGHKRKGSPIAHSPVRLSEDQLQKYNLPAAKLPEDTADMIRAVLCRHPAGVPLWRFSVVYKVEEEREREKERERERERE